METEDANRYYRWMNNCDVTRWTMSTTPIPLEAERRWVARMTEERPTTDHVFAVVLAEGDVHIGNTGIHRVDWVSRTASTGIIIGEPTHWGKGFGFEAKMLILRYAFTQINLRKVTASALDGNHASMRNLVKQGYREIGRHHAQEFRDGTYHDEVLYELFAEDFARVWEEHHVRILPMP